MKTANENGNKTKIKSQRRMGRGRTLSLLMVFWFLFEILCSCGDGKWAEYRKNSEQVTLPNICIDTENGAEIADREHYIGMTLSANNCREERYNLTNVRGSCAAEGILPGTFAKRSPTG